MARGKRQNRPARRRASPARGMFRSSCFGFEPQITAPGAQVDCDVVFRADPQAFHAQPAVGAGFQRQGILPPRTGGVTGLFAVSSADSRIFDPYFHRPGLGIQPGKAADRTKSHTESPLFEDQAENEGNHNDAKQNNRCNFRGGEGHGAEETDQKEPRPASSCCASISASGFAKADGFRPRG